MYYFKSILIKNYKNFSSQNPKKFFFSNGRNIIVGDNDTGKTTILECLKLFFNDKTITIDNKLVNQYNEDVHFEWEFCNEIDNNLHKIVLTLNKDENGIYKKTYSNWKEEYIYKEGKEKKYKEEWIAREKFLSEAALIIINTHSTLTEFNKNFDSVIKNDVLTEIKNEKEYANFKEVVENAVQNKGEEILKHLNNSNSINSEKGELQINTNINIDGAIDIIADSDDNHAMIINRGSGYLKNLNISLSTYSGSTNKIVIVDEIENSFSEENVGEIVKKIDGQLIATTHSSYIPYYLENSTINWVGGNDMIISNIIKKNEKQKIAVFVEGSYDIAPIKDVLGEDKYIYFNCSGESHVRSCIKKLDDSNIDDMKYFGIVDGDVEKEVSENILKLNKHGIEFYYKDEFVKKVISSEGHEGLVHIENYSELKECLDNDKGTLNRIKALLSKGYKKGDIVEDLHKEIGDFIALWEEY